MLAMSIIIAGYVLSAIASGLAIWLMWYKIVPTVNGFKASQERLDNVMNTVDETVKTESKKISDLVDEGRGILINEAREIQALRQDFDQMVTGALTVKQGEEYVIMPMSEHLRMAAESLLASLGGAYMSSDASQAEKSLHEMKLKGLSDVGYRIGLGVRKGIQLEKYDPLIARFAPMVGSNGPAPGIGEDPVAGILNAFGAPDELTGIAMGLFGGAQVNTGAPSQPQIRTGERFG
jgi:hypothetical protein